jgi:hypothetical protein
MPTSRKARAALGNLQVKARPLRLAVSRRATAAPRRVFWSREAGLPGHLTRTSYRRALPRLSPHPRRPLPRPRSGSSQELFEQLDTDSSGAITLEELSAGLRQQVSANRPWSARRAPPRRGIRRRGGPARPFLPLVRALTRRP